MGKLPPQAIEAEMATLGAILICSNGEAGEVINEVATILKPADYYKGQHQRIFKAMLDLHNQSKPVDVISLSEELQRREELETIGGAYYLTELAEKVASTVNVAYHAKIVLEKARRRQLINLIHEVSNQAYDPQFDISNIYSYITNFIDHQYEFGTERVIRLSDVESEDVNFLWEPYLPLGKLTLLEGDPGVGKSWITEAIATAVSLGYGLPGMLKNGPANVLLLSAEDGLEDTIKPRLERFEANCNRIFAVRGSLIFGSADLPLFEGYIKQYKSKLAIVDPLQAYFGSKVDMHRANETRPILSQLGEIAGKYSCAMILVRHLTKGGRDKDIYRGQGNIDLLAAARSVLLAGVDSNNPEQRAIIHTKSNLSPTGKAIGFKLENKQFYWTETDLTASDILSPQNPKLIDKAENLLLEILDEGPMLVDELIIEAQRQGITKRTLQRAKKKLKIEDFKIEFGGKTYWRIPKDGNNIPF